MTGKEKGNGGTFNTGFLVAILVAAIVIFLFRIVLSDFPCVAGRDLLEEMQIRIMVEDELSSSNDVCRFATDQGFVLYHDGQLYFEAEDGE